MPERTMQPYEKNILEYIFAIASVICASAYSKNISFQARGLLPEVLKALRGLEFLRLCRSHWLKGAQVRVPDSS